MLIAVFIKTVASDYAMYSFTNIRLKMINKQTAKLTKWNVMCNYHY